MSAPDAHAVECDGNPPRDTSDLKQYVDACQKKVDELEGQSQTLKAAIGALDSKIRLTAAQIKQTTAQIASLEKDVATLSTVLTDLDKTLGELSRIYLARVRESYLRRETSPITLFLSTDSFAKFFTRVRYLSIVKARDQLIISEMETVRVTYDTQKNAKITKQKDVEELKKRLLGQQSSLTTQQRDKNALLAATQNSEEKYKQLRAEAEADLKAIQGIIAGGGRETEIRDVSQGELIARVEPYRPNGDYCNSTGPHLHFSILASNDPYTETRNPFESLKQISYVNYSGGDQFNPTGDWDWPLNGPISFNQGYGNTFAIRTYGYGLYSFHNGIDIKGSSDEIHAVKAGKLVQGLFTGHRYNPSERNFSGPECDLKYVKVKHRDSSTVTLYIHVGF